MKVTLHQTQHQIADFTSRYAEIEKCLKGLKESTLHAFPELYLSGYPLQDLCLQKPFIERYQKSLEKINHLSLSLDPIKDAALLLGGLQYEFEEGTLIPHKIRNVCYLLEPGKILRPIYTKQLLPNYDIFDEKKYFTPGRESCIWSFGGLNIALLICEDMWSSNVHANDPCKELIKLANQEQKNIDFVINFSASPYHLKKQRHRLERGKEISHALKAPFLYVNQTCSEDEILFDGASLVIDGDDLIFKGPSFKPKDIEVNLDDLGFTKYKELPEQKSNTWEQLFSPRIDGKQLVPLSNPQCEDLIHGLNFGIQEYARKSGFKKFLVALSGGIDSSLVLTLLKLGLKEGQEVEAIYMPGKFSRSISWELSRQLCANLNIPLRTLPIKFLHAACNRAFIESFDAPLEGLSDENIQSRLRGALLYSRSNQTNAMVLNTSNKSEIAVGYSTQYGDSVGAISPLGDLFKSEVFQLSNYINKHFNNIIPEEIITRPPSAELRDDQKDEDSLPSYDRLDAILESILSYSHTSEDLIKTGHDPEEVKKILQLYAKSEYKRSQFCPIIKVRNKSFGFGYRIPITKNIKIYDIN